MLCVCVCVMIGNSSVSLSQPYPLTVADCRGLVKTLVCGMKTITWGVGACKPTSGSEWVWLVALQFCGRRGGIDGCHFTYQLLHELIVANVLSSNGQYMFK